MSSSPLFISFLWHMHQPCYKDPFSGIYRLPWVRLHGIKDYYDAVTILKEFPQIHQTFNLVPSLLKQLIDYIDGNATDEYLEISRVKAEELTDEQKVFLLSNFFSANWDNMVRPLPRYYELLVKRGKTVTREDIRALVRNFSIQDYLDLQVLFNLCWFDPILISEEPLLKELVKKGKDYAEDEKNMLLRKQIDVLSNIIPEYKRMKETGQIDITTSPFYHPILPLLYDVNSAKAAMPEVVLPDKAFSHPEDVEQQIRMALDYHERLFNFRPSGMWPSEGSVSKDILEIIEAEGIKWIATDEGILERSMGVSLRDAGGVLKEHQMLYKPYTLNNGLKIVFRDRVISDLIGFVYYRWHAADAVNDLIKRLYDIKFSLPDNYPFLVSIILDGENPWEYYKNDGRDFLLCLYERLSKEKGLETITISDYVERYGSEARIENLFPGSWINSNFGIWIGHEEDNLAWNMLSEARDSLSEYNKIHPEADLKEAWEAIYIAEGSDWCWWYGDEHVTENPEVFDDLFRKNLMRVYKAIDRDIPEHLYVPVLSEDRRVEPKIDIRGFISPKIDGEVTDYYEWLQAAYMETEFRGGAMHRAEALISRVYYGFDLTNLYIRVDACCPLVEISKDTIFSFYFLKPDKIKLEVLYKDGIIASIYKKIEDNKWQFLKSLKTIAINDILEVAIPFTDLHAGEGDGVAFFLSVLKENDIFEKWPWRGFISFKVPGEGFEDMMWQ